MSGYWLGPPCWFGSANPGGVEILGLPRDMRSVSRRTLRSGGDAAVTSNGVVLIDFTGLDGPEPTQGEIDQSPFGDDKTMGAASVLAQRRVEKLNAHQLCLLTAIGTRESEDDFWSPQPRPVEVETLVHAQDDGTLTAPPEIWRDVLEFATPTTNSIFQRSLFNVPLDKVDRSFDMFEQLLGGPPVAARAGHLVLLAADHYRRWRFDQALMAAWTAAEALLAVLWERYVDDSAASPARTGYVLNKKRRDRLHGADFTTSIVAEVLSLVGVIDQELFDQLSHARSARNRWVHGLAPVAHDAASSGVCSAERLLEMTTGVHLAAPLTLRSSGLP